MNWRRALFDDDFVDLSQKLQELLGAHKKIEELGANAREEMKNLPGWKIVVKKMENIYEELLWSSTFYE